MPKDIRRYQLQTCWLPTSSVTGGYPFNCDRSRAIATALSFSVRADTMFYQNQNNRRKKDTGMRSFSFRTFYGDGMDPWNVKPRSIRSPPLPFFPLSTCSNRILHTAIQGMGAGWVRGSSYLYVFVRQPKGMEVQHPTKGMVPGHCLPKRMTCTIHYNQNPPPIPTKHSTLGLTWKHVSRGFVGFPQFWERNQRGKEAANVFNLWPPFWYAYSGYWSINSPYKHQRKKEYYHLAVRKDGWQTYNRLMMSSARKRTRLDFELLQGVRG